MNENAAVLERVPDQVAEGVREPDRTPPRRRRADGPFPLDEGACARERPDEDGPSVPRGKANDDLGRRGEDAAARYLYRRGYEIVERNWTCAAGEADIIARDGEAVVFVEVKTRTSTDKGLPSDAVDAEKRRRYERIAALFLRDYDAVDVPVRFDVVSLLVSAPDRALVRHHINAFGTE